jgi:hypothetical protein
LPYLAKQLAAAKLPPTMGGAPIPPPLVGMATGINKAVGTIALEHIPFGAPHTPFSTVPAPIGAVIHQAAANSLWHGFSTAPKK